MVKKQKTIKTYLPVTGEVTRMVGAAGALGMDEIAGTTLEGREGIEVYEEGGERAGRVLHRSARGL